MIVRLIIIFICLSLLSPSLCFADSPGIAKEYIQYSANKKFYIKMIPFSEYGSSGRGDAYEITSSGDRFIWSIDWFGGVELSNDGQCLLKYGPWAQQFSDLAIAFYKEGKLLKEYKIEDLVKDKSKVQRSVSHFVWSRRYDFWKIQGIDFESGFSQDSKYYLLGTTDNRLYVFYSDSGEIYKQFQAEEMVYNPIEFFKKEGLSINFGK